MTLYLIQRTDEVDYDETVAILVRATNEQEARTLALAKHPVTWHPRHHEPDHVGLREDNLKITEVPTDGEAEVIIVDFLNG